MLVGIAHAQSAAVAEIESPVLASGGGETFGTGQEEVSATIGQPLTTEDTLTGVDNESVWIGFWAVLPADPSSIREERVARSVSRTRIRAIAPNPFRERVVFELDLEESASVVLTVHDALGREIARLIDGQRSNGAHRITWKPNDLPAGSYMLTLVVDGAAHSASPIQHYR
ncbi:MAG: T9SS type A sorting domain-containing protein [bacterium]|nr:T9SS type A sorting domain-containing protein [Candidatus Kapabacteria bacterium]